MPTTDMTLRSRTRGLWRLRLASWLLPRLVRGFRVEYRIGEGEWREMPMRLKVGWSPADDA